MGIFRKRQVRSMIKTLYGGSPAYFLYNYVQNIYNIPEVRTAISLFGKIVSTVPIWHERESKDGEVEFFTNEVLSLQANPVQNASQFWEEVTTRYFLNNNVFIEPVWDNATGKLKHLYVLPINYGGFEIKFLSENKATVTFSALNKTIDLDNLIYISRYSFLSGGAQNQLGLYETVIQALAKQALNVADPRKVRAIMQGKMSGNSNLKDRDSKGEMKTLEANFAENVNGIAYVDSRWEITPINWTENDVNRELMNLVIETVQNYFDMPESIIKGTASEMEISQFVAYKVQPFTKQVERALTAKLFTAKERGFGNRYAFDTFALQVKTLSSLTALFSNGIRNGVLNQDECREYIGQPPLPNGMGKVYRASADTVSLDIIDEYELGKFGIAAGNTQKKKEVTDEQAQGIYTL